MGQAETPESTLELQQLLAAVEALSEPQRVVVILVCVVGLTYEEAAQVTYFSGFDWSIFRRAVQPFLLDF